MGLFFIVSIQIKQRVFIRVHNSPRFFQQFFHTHLCCSRPYMHRFDYAIPFLVAHLHPCCPRGRLEFPNISHTLIVSRALALWSRIPAPYQISTVLPPNFSTKTIRIFREFPYV